MPICPKCKQRFEGKPNFCPHCGAKFNWPSSQTQQQAAAPAPKPASVGGVRPAPRPAMRPAPRRREPVYALTVKILMISFCGAAALFSLISLFCFFGDFLKIDNGWTSSKTNGFEIAFDFAKKKTANDAGFLGALIALVAVGTLIGFLIPRLIGDIKFLRAKERTRAVQKRRNKAIFNLVLFCSLAFVAALCVILTKPITGAGDGVDLGGGAIAIFVFMIFVIGFVVAEEVLVLTLLRLTPRQRAPRYNNDDDEIVEEYYEEESPEAE